MIINKYQSINFNGYDAVTLRGLYMQGIKSKGERTIFRELKTIAQKEGIDIFLNRSNTEIKEDIDKTRYVHKGLSIWGQDRKAFVVNKNGRQILWSTKEPLMKQVNLGKLDDFGIQYAKYMPRGGNYFIGVKNNGTKWLLINGCTVGSLKMFQDFGETPTRQMLTEIFDIKPDNIFSLNFFTYDMDEVVRPIGYPNILVNDFAESLKNLDKMQVKYPDSEVYLPMKKYIYNSLYDDEEMTTDEICKYLTNKGFNPIKIGACYHDSINYINAIAMRNKKGKISYITNSTQKSYPELEYLQQLFDSDLREKVPEVSDTYYVIGGKKDSTVNNTDEDALSYLNFGLYNSNSIMDILANRFGGVHCMTAEIPKFDSNGKLILTA